MPPPSPFPLRSHRGSDRFRRASCTSLQTSDIRLSRTPCCGLSVSRPPRPRAFAFHLRFLLPRPPPCTGSPGRMPREQFNLHSVCVSQKREREGGWPPPPSHLFGARDACVLQCDPQTEPIDEVVIRRAVGPAPPRSPPLPPSSSTPPVFEQAGQPETI